MSSSATSAVTIVPLQPRDTKAFITFAWQVYVKDPHWRPPLIMERKAFLNQRKNPFFLDAEMQLFVAKQNGNIIGRIAAVIQHQHDRYHHERAGFFGLFECLPQAEDAARALLNATTAWVRDRGATFCRGPLHLSMNALACGLLVEGYNAPPVFDSAYNPLYYAEYIEDNGFTPCKDLLAYRQLCTPLLPQRVAPTIERLRRRQAVTIRPINMREFTAEIVQITTIYNDAWSDNWGFVPISEADAQHLAKTLKFTVIPQLALIAEIKGERVGCLIAIPDLNQALRHLHGHLTPWGLIRFFYQRRRIDTVRVAMMGVKKRYRRLGIDLLLMANAWDASLQLGITQAELAWVLEDNQMMTQGLEAIGATPYKRYRLYQKELT